MKARRWILWIFVLALVVSLAVLAVRPRPVPAEIAPVVNAPLEVTIDEEGETRVRDRFMISAPVAGRVLRIELEPGDRVVAGETVVASFEPSTPVLLDARTRAEAEAAVEADEAALGGAQALLEQTAAEVSFAEADVGRNRRLMSEGIVSDEAFEIAELDLRTKREALEAADYAVRTARGALRVSRSRLLQATSSRGGGTTLTLRSPIDGVVLRRLRESESVVPPGESLLEVGDSSRIEVVTDYLSRDAVRMRRGQRAYVERWGGPGALEGRVQRVEPSGFTKISALGVEEQRVNVVIDLVGDGSAWRGLGDGYRVETRVVVWEEDEVLSVPTGALFRHGDEWSVFAVDVGIASLRKVEVGERNQRFAQVVSGLEVGEEVVVHPSDSIADGTLVTESTPSSP